jgi:hypothetical protein
MAMSTLFSLLSFLAVSSPGGKWQMVFEGTGADGWVSSVRASSADNWIAAGGWGVATAQGTNLTRRTTPGTAILGLRSEANEGTFAFGSNEAILRFDGHAWIDEHVGVTPRRRGRGADLLYRGFREQASGPMIAVGPSLVLVRQPDGHWTEPPAKERARLLDVSIVGPKITRPDHCAPAGWSWLEGHRSVFFCHDRRIFVYEEGVLRPKGKMPAECDGAVLSFAYDRNELYASCDGGTLWKTKDENWTSIAPPVRHAELGSISIAAGCLFVTAERTVWRSCTNDR